MNVRALLLLLAALPLLGATGADPDMPVVVVYPLTASGDVGASETGSNIGTAISNKLVQLGGLTVKPFIAGTARAQYLTAADSQGADYYITGYVTPLGSEVSVVEQVVSTRSGSIVYSTTAFAKTYADAVGPAATLREAILRHAGRGLGYLNAPPPPTASPEPITSGGGVNISKAFGRHRKGAPAAAASAQPQTSVSASPPAASAATATAPAPASVALAAQPAGKSLVVATAGTAEAAARLYASSSLGRALERGGVTNAALTVDAGDVAAHAAELCKANAANGFYVPTLTVTGPSGGSSVQLDVVAYDCRGNVTGKQQAAASAGKRGSVRSAIDAATSRIAKGFTTSNGPATPATPRAAS